MLLAAAAVLFAVLALVIDPLPGEGQGIDLGEENSWIRIQNVGTSGGAVEIDFYDTAGQLVATEECPAAGCDAVPPGSGWSFFQQTNTDLARGYRGSGFVTVDQPFVALLARDVRRSDGSFRIAGDTLRLASGTSRLLAPIVQNTEGYASRISVENVSDVDAACVEITYYGDGQLDPAAVDPASPSSGCSQGGERVGPRATLLRDEHNLPVGLGFDGSAVIRTYPVDGGLSADAQQLAVTVDTRSRAGAGLATYRGIGQDEVSRVVVLPLADRNASEGGSTWSNRFRITNATPSVPNEVTLLFDGVDAAGSRVEVEHTVTVNGSRTCDQRLAGAAACLPGGETLPSTFRGTVRMQSVDPIAVVAQRISGDGSLADYRGFTAEEASTQVVLPVVNKNYGQWNGNGGWNSWFRVLTFDGSVAHVTVVYYGKQFPGGRSTGSVRVDGQATFRQWESRLLPDEFVGSAVVVADRPVVVVANLESDVFSGDPVMLYNGVSLE
ncbi:MAG: hypothetical protein GEU80_17140 [Dehalococcoidia bacterium]|nr:hypothetical protein [Dehalococcoidia bacterium]